MLCGTGLNRRTMPIRIGFGQYIGAICQKILSIGSMPFLIIVLDNLLIILLNAMLRKYGGGLGDQYISYAAVVQSVMVVVICPAEGLTSGCATLFSYYYTVLEITNAFSTVSAMCCSTPACTCVH